MCDERLFLPQISALNAEREVFAPPISEHDTISTLAGSVLDNAPPKFALAGLSMGGIVAMEIVRQSPDRIERLALMDTNPLAELPEMKAKRAPQIDQARAGQLDSVMRDEMKPNYLIDSPTKPALMDLCMDMALKLGPDVFVRQSTALRDRPDQCDTLRGIKVPTLILCGRHDQLCPVERHELMASLIPVADLQIVEDAAHLPTLEQPERTTAALKTWLEH